MRSTVKILLGCKVIIGIIYFISTFIFSIYILLDINNLATKYDCTKNQLYYLILFFGITATLLLAGAIVSFYVRNKLNSAYHKKELTLSIILLYVTLGFISGSLILFSPSKIILSKHPYFE